MCILCFTGKYTTECHIPQHDYFIVVGGKLDILRFSDFGTGNVLALVDSTRRFSLGSWRDASSRSRIDSLKSNERILLQLYYRWLEAYIRKASLQTTMAVNDHALGSLSDILRKSNRGSIGSDMPGYIDRRCDFDVEYDDSAELIIADLEINQDDTLEERAVKVDCLRHLTNRIERREAMKEFTRENRLLKIQHQIDSFRAKTSEEADIAGKTRPLRRFFESSVEVNYFNQVMLYERRLRARLTAIGADLVTPNTNRGESPVIPPQQEDADPAVPRAEADARPVTRSKSLLDSRRMKMTDTEMNRIIDILATETSKVEISESSRSDDFTAIERFGLQSFPFAILKGSLLRRFNDTPDGSVAICVQKYGSTWVISAERNS